MSSETADRTVTCIPEVAGRPKENGMNAWRLLAAAGVTVGLITPGGAAGATPAPSVQGSGRVTLSAAYDELAGDPVRFQLQARGVGGATRGTFNVVHLDAAGGLYAHFEGDVTCASIVGGVAYTTGIIRKGWLREYPDLNLQGSAAAITVSDGGRTNDVLGFDFEFFGSTIQPCQNRKVGPGLPVESGNFIVR